MNKRYSKELTIEELAALPDDAVDTSDIPPLDETFWQNAKLVEPDPTQQITLRVKNRSSTPTRRRARVIRPV